MGVVPVIGNLAFAAQIVVSSHNEHKTLARFILHDMCSMLGQLLPIWGGQDSRTEHVMNRAPNLFISSQVSVAGAPVASYGMCPDTTR